MSLSAVVQDANLVYESLLHHGCSNCIGCASPDLH